MSEDKTTNTHSEDNYEARVKRVSRHIRHIGFGLFGGSAFLMMAFLMTSVVQGVNNHEIYDPFTHEKIDTAKPEVHAAQPKMDAASAPVEAVKTNNGAADSQVLKP